MTLLGCAACDSVVPGEPDNDPPITTTPPAVEFTSAVEVRDRAVHVTYRLTNRSGTDLIALNRDSPAGVYITGSGPGQVTIAERVFPRPDTTTMTWYVSPQVSGTVLAPGDTTGDDFTVPLPLERRHPYGNDYGDGVIPLPDPVTEIRFCLGVIRPADLPVPAATASAAPGSAHPSVVLPHLGVNAQVQHLSCTDPAPL
ncbi:hypothetical protein [Actinoplanes awajinensis]|uniref:DUF4232 domain-containing protein n=1 Tax=Actinoplanes awajinensis subsp. mycoplanecinus TaxID=135947 RepID=A0A101JUK6_9ACTN|nr:hypothetical protein [Actinoplanes awajinensis]KUL33003.1 hypothetical protein ADL15_18465 [Actinoplanes awajinensis subsp. mycoplanecinus]